MIDRDFSSLISERTKMVWPSSDVSASTSSHTAFLTVQQSSYVREREGSRDATERLWTMSQCVRAICSYGTATPVKRMMSCFQKTPNVIATTNAITASLINARRFCALRLVARCALAMISRVSTAALRSASVRFAASAARFRSCVLRFGPMVIGYPDSLSTAKHQQT
jgi:hypothetical protein